MKTIKRAFRMFSIAQPDRLESYLETMALKGWHLSGLAIKPGIFTFRKGRPEKILYCLRNMWERPIGDIRQLETDGWGILDAGHDWRILWHSAIPIVTKIHRDDEFLANWLRSASSVAAVNMCLFGLMAVFFAVITAFCIVRILPLALPGFGVCLMALSMFFYFTFNLRRMKQGKAGHGETASIKREIRILPIWDEEAMDHYLNEKSAQGWHLVRANALMNFLTFVKGQPGEFEYCVRNRRGKALSDSDAPRIISAGWGLLYVSPLVFGWHIFRKKTGSSNGNISTDPSASRHYTTLLAVTLLSPILFMALLCGFIALMLAI